jgi:hypothetical protein
MLSYLFYCVIGGCGIAVINNQLIGETPNPRKTVCASVDFRGDVSRTGSEDRRWECTHRIAQR